MTLGKISTKSLKQLYASSGNQCMQGNCQHAIIDQHGLLDGRILKIRSEGQIDQSSALAQPDVYWISCNALLLVCPACEKRIQNETLLFTSERLLTTKQQHEKRHARACLRSDAKIALRLRECIPCQDQRVTFVVDTQGVVTKSKPIFVPPAVSLPEQTIGDDRIACDYIGYLILRYNEFAAKELKPSDQFNSKIISQNLKSRYKSHWRDLPRVRFPHVCRYLKHRIDITRIAKSNRRKGFSSYRSYDEFLRNPKKR